MTDSAATATVDILRDMQDDLAAIHDDLREIDGCLGTIESGLVEIRRDIGGLAASVASLRVGQDRMVERMERIERRLEIN